MRQLCLVAATAAIMTAIASGEVINDPSFFDGLDAITIDFDSLPRSGGTPPDMSALSDQYVDLGILFSSEDVPGALQTTDPADASGRFGAACRYLAAVSGGGVPTSAPRYAGGDTFAGSEVSDMRLDFTSPVAAVAGQVIDNDFTDVRVSAYGDDGTLLEEFVIPEVPEGGLGYWGVAVEGISYIIVDAAGGGSLDSTYLDDLTFTVSTGTCLGDLNDDGAVDGADLGLLLGAWGTAGPGDLDGNGTVDGADLGLLLGAWGDC